MQADDRTENCQRHDCEDFLFFVHCPSPPGRLKRRVKFVELNSMGRAHIYDIRPRKDHRGVDLLSDALPFGGL
jgi:hypothetical protein